MVLVARILLRGIVDLGRLDVSDAKIKQLAWQCPQEEHVFGSLFACSYLASDFQRIKFSL